LRAVCSIFIIAIVVFSLVIEFGYNLEHGDFVVDQSNIVDYYKEYQTKMIEDKIDEYIYEDDDESEGYEDDYEDFLKMKEKFADALNLAPSKIEHDEEWRKTDKVMKVRVGQIIKIFRFVKFLAFLGEILVFRGDFKGVLKRIFKISYFVRLL